MPALAHNPVNFTGTRSQYAEAFLRWENDPYSLTDYPMFRAIYDGDFQKILLKTCRQVGKSMTLSTLSISECLAIPHFKTFFIAPTKEQTLSFSTSRVGKFIQFSPLVRDFFVNSDTTTRVLKRQFSHGSEINFSYASDDADRCRGQSCDRLMLDEVQDMLLDVVRPVVRECLRQSKLGSYETYCGTPKSMENGIETMWEASTQYEWVIQCQSCKRSSIILSEKQCGLKGPVCTGCQAYLNPRLGKWVRMNKNPEITTAGFHIARPIMPTNVPAAWPNGSKQQDDALKKWKDVLGNLDGPDAYPISTFRNEVLGMSDSQGARLVSLQHLRAMQDGPAIARSPTKDNMLLVTKVSAGIDWSGGGGASTDKDGSVVIKSRTVLSILGKMGIGRTRLLYFKIFPGLAPLEELEEIIATLQAYDQKAQHQMFIGGDAGEGNLSIDVLRHRLPNPTRIVKYRYSGNFNGYIGWNKKKNCYVVNRTSAIDSLMTAFLRGEFQFPQLPENVMDVAFKDILAAYEEVTGEAMGMPVKRWRHAASQPDDFLHALNFARMSLQVALKEVNLTSNIPEDVD